MQAVKRLRDQEDEARISLETVVKELSSIKNKKNKKRKNIKVVISSDDDSDEDDEDIGGDDDGSGSVSSSEKTADLHFDPDPAAGESDDCESD